MLIRSLFVFLLSVSYLHISFAASIESETFDLTLKSDAAITITRFGDDGDRILWIPSEHGINKEKHFELMTALAKYQHQVWLAEIHESYFITPGRSSYTTIPVDDIAELIENSLPENNRKLYIVSTSRGAALSLLAINRWQNKTGGSEKFGGIIMLHPNLQADTPTPGTAMEFLPVVDVTQLAIVIIQPEKSNKYWYLKDLVNRLNDSGSRVYSQVIQQAGDGYHVRPDASESEQQKARELPLEISRAIQLLAQTKITTHKKPGQSAAQLNQPWKIKPLATSLQAYPEKAAAPALELNDITGKKYRLEDFRGRVVILNFWASWCPPCVKEIPSLGRLQKNFSKQDLVVLSVDIGESKKEVESFLKQVPADFPVLLDADGSTVKQWKVIAFPTTFVISQQGTIELAYYGALEWDEPAVVAQLRDMIRAVKN